MDSYILRLILLALGVILVVGIYFWDRYNRIARRFPKIKAQRETPVVEPEEKLSDVESFTSSPSDEGPSFTIEDDVSDKEVSLDLDDELPQGESVGEPVVLQEWDQVKSSDEAQFSLDLEFNAHGESDYLQMDPALLDEVPRKIIQLNIQSRDKPFSAADIQRATKEVEMVFGDMDIYHRELDDGSGQVLFSMASLVEPGTFPKGKDDKFATPGLSLFTQLPGVRDGLAIYSDMLFTAERLAASLDAVLQDETHSVLTKQSIEHTREGILEHRRQIQLLRSRH